MQGQLMFMAAALWTFAWPWTFLYGAQENHEKRIEADWTTFRRIQIELNRAIRFGDDKAAELPIKAMTDLYHRDQLGDLSHPELPDRREGAPATDYAEKLLDFSLQHPPVATQHSSLLANLWTVGASISTTVLATYFYTITFQDHNLHWHGIDWSDWNFFARLPEGDGVDGLILKSVILTFGALGLQKFFDFSWDWLRLNAFPPQDPIRRSQLAERYQRSKKAVLTPINSLYGVCGRAFRPSR